MKKWWLAGSEYLPLVRLGQTPRAATWLSVQVQSLLAGALAAVDRSLHE